MANHELNATWKQHLRNAEPVLSQDLGNRVVLFTAEMGRDTGNQLLRDLGLRAIPVRTTKSGPKEIERFCKRLMRERGLRYIGPPPLPIPEPPVPVPVPAPLPQGNPLMSVATNSSSNDSHDCADRSMSVHGNDTNRNIWNTNGVTRSFVPPPPPPMSS